ncbi:MAG: glycosyltransferase family 39 protein, partial [Anaerolineae bacterium]|nr:glycosyltransferase family 39 protein [Anaerolineae bacterium]
MMVVHRWLGNWKLARVGTVGALVALVVFHAINNWRWLTTNVTMLGWDLPSNLGTSLIYNRMLHPFSLKTLFSVVTWHPLHPPLFFLSAVPLYRLFGDSVDVGTMVNVLYLALLIGSVYGIGQRLGGRRVGLLAAFVVATFPTTYAMSRYFYLELALTAIVALSVCLLLASDGFENRTASLLFGLSFGLGLLTKSTYLVFIFAPLCLVAMRSQALKSLKRRLRAGFRLNVRDALLALVIGLALAAVWYLPGREIARHDLALGDWLLPLWAVLAAMTIYLVRRKPGPDTNFLSALFLGGTMGSLWYLACVTSVRLMLQEGFGVNDPQERSANLNQPGTYIHFLVNLINEHISLVYFAFLVVAVLGLLLSLRRKRDIWAALRRASDAWWVTLLWLVGSYLLLTLSIYRVSRGIMPVLPALALIMAAGLFRLPWRKVVALLVVLVIGWGLLQFFVLSYEGPHWLAERTTFTLPVLGETGLFARGGLIQLPAAGETDRDYWVMPDILRLVDAERQTAGAETVRLGVLVNNQHVNRDLFGLLVLQSYPGIQLRDLAYTYGGDSVYAQLFEQDYLVLIEGRHNRVDAAAGEALRHLDEAPDFFEATFKLVRRFPLPDGDMVLLYRKVWRLAPGYDVDDYHAVAQTITAFAQEGDAILLVPPEQVEALGRTYNGRLPPSLLPPERLLDPETTAQALEEITARHPILFAVFRSDEAADPARFIESWLNERAYRSQSEWHGGVRLVVYGAPSHRAEIEHSLDIRLGEQVRLLGYSLAEDAVAQGRMVRLTLFWQAEEPVAERLTVFAHLLDGDGRLVAQQDSEPVGGSRPTRTWTAGEVLRDHIGILIPPGTAGGEYRLVVGMYRPDTGERLPVLDEEG